MGGLEYLRKTNHFNLITLGVFALIGLGFVFGTLEIIEDTPEAFPIIPLGAVILGLCVVNFFLGRGSSEPDSYGIADILSWLAIGIIVLMMASQLYAEEFSDGEFRLNEETGEASFFLVGVLALVAMVVPAKWAIGKGSQQKKAKEAVTAKAKTSAKTTAVKGRGTSVTDAIMLPFRQITNVIISFILCATGLVILPLLPLQGHIIRAAKKTYEKGSYVLPEWNDWGDLVKKGFVATVIVGIYLIPLVVYSSGFVTNMPFPEEDMEKPGAMLGGLWVMNATDPVFTILVIAIEYVMAMALVLYAVKGNFGSAFSFGEIFRNILNVEYFKAWVVPAIYLVVLLLAVSAVFAPIMQGYIESVEEEGDPEWENVQTLAGLGAAYLIFQMFALYLATISQTTAIALVYRKLEKG